MRYLLPLLLLAANLMTAQVGKVESVRKRVLIGSTNVDIAHSHSLAYYVTDEGKLYMLTYFDKDLPFKENIRIIGFSATPEELEYVFQFFEDGFSSDEIRYLDLGEDRVRVIKSDTPDLIYIDVYHGSQVDGSFTLKHEQLDRLFGNE